MSGLRRLVLALSVIVVLASPILAVMAGLVLDKYHLPSQWLLFAVPTAAVLLVVFLPGKMAWRYVPKAVGQGFGAVARGGPALLFALVYLAFVLFLALTALRIVLKIIEWAWA